MQTLTKTAFLLSLTLSFVGTNSLWAYSYGDWKTNRVQLGGTLGESCVSQTTTQFEGRQWKLSYVASAQGVNAAFFVSAPENYDVSDLKLRSSGSSSLFDLRSLPSLNDQLTGNAFWQLPLEVATLYTRIRADQSVRLTFKDTQARTKTLYFSLKGSLKNFDELMRACGLKSAVNNDFFNRLKSANAHSGSGAVVSTESLWQEQAQAEELYRAVLLIKAELQAKQTEMNPILAAQTEYLRRAGQIDGNLSNALSLKSNKETELVNVESSLLDKEDDLLDAEAQLQPAQVKLDIAQDRFRPVREGAQTHLDAVQNATAQVTRSQSEVNNASGAVTRLNSEIASLERERNTLSQRISALRSDQDTLNRNLNNAEWEYRNFNPHRELERRKSSDAHLGLIQSNINLVHNRIRTTESELARARRDTQNARSHLDNCLRQPTPNCSSQQNAYNQALQRESRLVNDINHLRSSLQNMDYQYQSRVREISNQVDNEHRALANRASNLRQRLNDNQNELNSSYYRQDRIASDLISKRSQESQLQMQLQNAQNRLSDSRNQLNAANSRLESYKASTGYSRLEADYYAALNDVQKIQSSINSINQQIQSLNTRRNSLYAEIQTLQNRIENLIADKSRTSEELLALEARLAPLKAQKEQITQELNSTERDFALSASTHKNILTALINGTSLAPAQAPILARTQTSSMSIMNMNTNNSLSDIKEPKLQQDNSEFWDWLR